MGNDMKEQQTILIYGDSLVWGMDPQTHDRLPKEDRWVGVLQNELGESYDVLPEGLRSRMFYGENPYKTELDGYAQYGPILGSHLPVDIVVIMLGTNDCSAGAGKSSEMIADAIPLYVDKTRKWAERCRVGMPKMIFISPQYIVEELANNDLRYRFTGSEAKSKRLAEVYQSQIKALGVLFFDAAEHIVASDTDGIHLDTKNNRVLGEEFAKYIRNLK